MSHAHRFRRLHGFDHVRQQIPRWRPRLGTYRPLSSAVTCQCNYCCCFHLLAALDCPVARGLLTGEENDYNTMVFFISLPDHFLGPDNLSWVFRYFLCTSNNSTCTTSGSFRCRLNCATCPYIVNGLNQYTFHSTGETHSINSHITCITSRANEQYIS